MGLKESRQVFQTNVDFAASGAMERGGIASIVPWTNGLVYYATGSGQVPIGLVLEDIESINYFLQPQYLNRNVSPLGSMVGLATEGEFWTNMVDTNITFTAGDKLYLIGSGRITNIASVVPVSDKQVGICLQGNDSDGYIKIRLQIILETT